MCLPTLALEPVDDCISGDELLVVHVSLHDYAALCAPINGGQFMLQYNPTMLQFVSATPGDGSNAIDTQIYLDVNETFGTIDYAVGFSNPGNGITGGAMAALTFNVLVQDWSADALLGFRDDTPPTRLTDVDGEHYDVDSGNLTLVDLPTLVPDTILPLINCPGNKVLMAGADGCNDTGLGQATVRDACAAPGVPRRRVGG